jgi:hypothetical protein
MALRTVSIAAVAAAVSIPFLSLDAQAASPVRFSRVQYDSPGRDTGSNASLNAEWVRVTNHANQARTLTGWTIRDPAGHVYRFPTFKLRPGRSVQIHTGSGRNTATDLYWRQDSYVWNNTGDRAVLRNRAGDRVDTCRWGDGSGTTAC